MNLNMVSVQTKFIVTSASVISRWRSMIVGVVAQGAAVGVLTRAAEVLVAAPTTGTEGIYSYIKLKLKRVSLSPC